MLGRRAFLKKVGGTAAVASTMSVKDAAKIVGTDKVPGLASTLEGQPEVGNAAFFRPNPLYEKLWNLRERMSNAGQKSMPPHIATKKSWSPVFKASEWHHELDLIQAAVDLAERDDEVARKLAGFLGVSFPPKETE